MTDDSSIEIDSDIDNYRNAFAFLLSVGMLDAAARGVVGLAW